jgi:hypothetical protein
MLRIAQDPGHWVCRESSEPSEPFEPFEWQPETGKGSRTSNLKSQPPSRPYAHPSERAAFLLSWQ